MNSTILVAENDTEVRTFISETLEGAGYAVKAVSSHDQAVRSIESVEPGVVIAGVNLGDGGGAALCHWLKSAGMTLPVILVSRREGDNSKENIKRWGCADVMIIPLDPWRLVRHVAEIVSSHGTPPQANMDGGLYASSHLKALLNTGDEAVFLLDASGAILDYSENIFAVTGIAEKDLHSRNYLEVLPALSVGLQKTLFARVIAACLPMRLEEHRDGGVFDTTLRPVVEAGQAVGYIVVTKDITAQSQSEAGLAESEKRYRSVYEAARDAIILFDRESGAILDCNGAARKMYGYSLDEMLEVNIIDLSDEPERSMEAVQAEVKYVHLRRHRKKNGMVFSAEVSMSHFIHNGRKVTTAYVQDISHRKMAEEALREGARLYRAVVEDQTELIARFEPDGELTFTNGAYAKFFGIDEDELTGVSAFAGMLPEDKVTFDKWMNGVVPGSPSVDIEQLTTRHDGVQRLVLWTHRAIFNHRDQLTEFQSIGRDVTDHKEAEIALGQATEEKEQYRLNLEATFRSIPDAIVTVDSELNVIATNSAAKGLLGIARGGQARGQNLRSLIPSAGNPCINVLEQVLRSSKPVHNYEAELDSTDYGERVVELNCSPLIDQNKRHTGAVMVVRDISRIADLEKRLHERHGFRGIIGRSSVMQDVYHLLEQLSSLDSTVLILGASGTGKELVADALHYGGARAGQPLVKVNCSALSESLLESELFGHVRGAFTGAVRDKIGRIQAAQGGTLFLDEVGDISPLIQLKLLRFLEQKEYERVGDSKTRSADVRIIAATNVDLRKAVHAGAFREDLYYRLNVMPVFLPSLCERQSDIPLLVEHFLETFSGQFHKSFHKISDEVMDLFMKYTWPGNIRELKHLLEHACILCSGGTIGVKHIRKDLLDQMRGTTHSPPVSEEIRPMVARIHVGKEDVLQALVHCAGNKSRAAKQLGIHRATLYRKLKEWGLDV